VLAGPWRRADLALLLVAAATALVSIVYLGLPHRFWFEDDPWQYAAVRTVGNPLRFFFDSSVMRGFGTGASAVPMQLLSYWVDVKSFGVSPLAAYVHSTVTLTVVAVLLYLGLRRLTASRFASAFVTLLWVLLPSTISVHFFISARHYLEGFGWSLLACLLLIDLCEGGDQGRSRGKLLLLGASALAAMLSKEIYVTTLPAFIFCYSVAKRRTLIAAAALALPAAYAGYRLWLIGGTGAYPIPLLGARGYLRYLKVLPYTMTVSTGGYLVLAGTAIGCIWLLATRPRGTWKPMALMLVLLAAALAASYPTASAVLDTFLTPGTWYRAAFVINTLLLLSGGYLLLRFASRPVVVASLALAAVLVATGAEKTREHWDSVLSHAECEARFYLANPDKLLLSQEAVGWYLAGIERLYEVREPHYLNVQSLKGDHAKEMVGRFSTVWRLEDGRPIRDQQLYWRVKALNGS
jgi:hypothetical protein